MITLGGTELRVLSGDAERDVIAKVREIIAIKQKATRDVAHWERGWQQNLEAFKASGNVDDLRPRYIRENLPLRLNGKFVVADDPDYEWRWYQRFFEEIADRWLDTPFVWEFGCGSGHNVAWLAAERGKNVIGLDWSQAAVDICNEIGERWITGSRVSGCKFDFFAPGPPDEFIAGDVTVLTVGAMEQTGKLWRPMLDYLLAAKPKRVVHIEPILDWYDPSNPVDRTAIEAHKARGFWEGYYEALRNLRGQGRVEIEHTERTGFGSLLIEGYSQLIWRPL